MSRARHLLMQWLVAIVIVALIAAMAAFLVVRSGWFRELVRQRIIHEVETATGGKVEIGNFSFKWETLTAKVAPLILHGTEPVSETPLLRVESASLGLRVISMLERKVDLAFVRVDQPRLRIVIYPDGSDNLPVPSAVRTGRNWAENLVDVAVKKYEVTGGLAEVDVRQIPLNFRGEDLSLQMTRDSLRPIYRGSLSSRRLRIASSVTAPIELDMSARFVLEGPRLNLAPLHLAFGNSKIDLTGSLTDLQAPRGTFKAIAAVALRDAVPLFSLPLAPAGTASFDGDATVSFAHGFDYMLSGRADARGLGYAQGRLKIENAAANAALHVIPGRVTLRNLTAHALGADIDGQADLTANRNVHFEGNVRGLTIREAAGILTPRAIPWDGMLTAAIEADAAIGQTGAKVRAKAAIVPITGRPPMQGEIEVTYDQGAGTINFGESHVSTPSTDLALSGTLGQILDVRARTTSMDDLQAALAMAGDAAPGAFPLQLKRGQGDASVAGTIAGHLENPEFRGHVSIGGASISGHAFDRFTSDVQASRSSIALRGLSVARGATQIAGDAAVTANQQDFMTGPVTAQLTVKNLSLAEAAHELSTDSGAAGSGMAGSGMAGSGMAGSGMEGTASATVHLTGTPRNPIADVDVDAVNFAVAGEHAERLRAILHYTARSVAFSRGQADTASGKVTFTGSFDHLENDYRNGTLQADVTAQGLVMSRVPDLHARFPDADARLDAKGSLQVQLSAGALDVRALNGDASVRALAIGDEKLGDVALTAATSGNRLALHAKAQIRGAAFDGDGQWRLEGDLPGTATLRFPRLTVDALHDLVMLRGTAAEKAPPSFDGFLTGNAAVTVALRAPQDFKAEVKIDTLQLNPKASQSLRLDVKPQDVQIRNSQPILVAVTAKEARISAAHFTARETNLEATGTIPFTSTGGADLAVKGTVNLAILQLLNSDLLARGTANVNASIRGSVRDPQVNGRMEFSGASLYMNDLPNGIDSASGAVVFDRNRATIDHLTAETGGGQIILRGFVDFGGTLIYRLQADARQVRVRYPADVSLTGNAQLALTGTSDASTLSGTVTLNRAAISAGADLGKLLAQAAKPSPAPPEPSDYLRGMRFDVRIGNAPTFELETSLTRNVQTEVDLRLRGTPLSPALLGSVAMNSGEIQVFGNRYTVNRGDIRFLNPVKIEPTFDVDLETRTSGITVNVTMSGSAEHLNVNYSSDPPLQSSEIIALLAVGRDPTALGSAAQFSSSTAGFSDAGGLLGEAVSQQLSNRLQRFFGASRVKIDPTLTGVDNLPAARLTIEQQVARDITVTYITNLNRTQEQIVRVEWEFNQHWSAVAVRNSNGLFGIDFQYRKRFR